MPRNISDIIEQYLKQIMMKSSSGMVELQRSELAELFQCVPSQINYVISTRFTVDQGYVVESKRGGGGYIRIRQIEMNSHQPLVQILKSIEGSLSQREAEGLIEQLERAGIVTRREAAVLKVAMNREVLRLDITARDELRARLLAQMLYALFTAVDESPEDEE